MENARLGLQEKVGYALGDTASVLYFHTFSQFLMYFYTDVFGIDANAVGTMFLITRFFDAAIDPFIGMLCDRTRSVYGKFRPWLMWGLFPYMVLGVLTFTVPDFSRDGKVVYAYVTYLAVSAAYSVVNIPYGALMGVMTPVSEERTVLASFRFYGAYAAVFIVNLTLLKFVRWFGAGDEAAGYQRTMLVYALAAGSLFFVTFKTTRERVLPPADQRGGFFTDLSQLMRNGPWLAICGIGIVTLIWVSLRNAAVMYFMKYHVKADEDFTTTFLTVGTLATLSGVAITKTCERSLGGKKWAYVILTLASSSVATGFYFVDVSNLALLFLVHVVSACLAGPLMPLFWSMIADTADYAEWKFERRFTGLIFSAGTFSQQSGWALGSAFAGWLLAGYGYEANADQSTKTVSGIKQLMSFFPWGVALVGAAAALLYGISPEVAKRIQLDLEARKTGQGRAGRASP
jgi:GPH family glycoside/pentoside/hexuronide:cation symporter